MMSALDNLQAAQAAIDSAVGVAVTALNDDTQETAIQAVADDLNAQAAALTAAGSPPVVSPPVTPTA
jgi:hypothetical protein